MDGFDVSEAWRDSGAMPTPRFLYSEADHNNVVDGVSRSDIMRMVRLEDTKLIYNTVTGEKLLFDLATDPEVNRTDLAASDPERTELLWSRLEMPSCSARDPPRTSAPWMTRRSRCSTTWATADRASDASRCPARL